MKRLLSITLVGLLAFACLSIAAPDPSGKCDKMYYDETDAFGWVVKTIPSTNPGPGSVWVGISYANGEILQFKNAGMPVGAQMLRINPITGAVIATVNMAFPTTGFMMEGAWDGTYLYCCQWYPASAAGIRKMTLAGTYVSTVVPIPALTGSPRGIAWSGSNLWVGTNVSGNVTNLYKMSTGGAVSGSWSTNSVVGWYMGMDWDSNAPAGGQLCVVDNVGNTIKRIGIPPVILKSAPSPAVTPDLAEGLGFDGELLIHCGGRASQLKVWFLDDGSLDINTTLIAWDPNLIRYNLELHNYSATTRTFQIWSRLRSVGGSVNVLVFGPITLSLPGLANPTYTLSQPIPSSIPPGDYNYISYLGTYPSVIRDSSYFSNSHAGDGGGLSGRGDDPNRSLDEFNQRVANGQESSLSVANAQEFALLGAAPNPFNPSTTISFQLPAAEQVKLSVYDVSGRLVSTLIEGLRDAGTHLVTFDGSNLTSGVYLYTLEAGPQHATGKMVLMK